MTDEPFYSPNRKPAPVRLGKPGERLFEFRKDVDRYVCELRDHGQYGIEAQFLLNGDLHIARTFQDHPDLGLRARDLAIAWADQQRKSDGVRRRDRERGLRTAGCGRLKVNY